MEKILFGMFAGLVAAIVAGNALGQTADKAAAAAGIEGAEKRVALIIGNADYESAPLRNPVNDARVMAATLKALGFSVTALENASQSAMKQAIDEFGESLHNAGKNPVGLFYYSGHGMQVKGRNYMIPVAAKIRTERQVEYEAVDVSRALAAMEDAGNTLNIVILDACRDNPFSRSARNPVGGLALLDAASGTLIAYATAPGRTADDGTGRNGLYTEQLIRHMRTPGLKVEEVFKRVRNDVERLSGRKQVPWESSSLKGDFYFVDRPNQLAAAIPLEPERLLDEEEVLWRAIESSSSAQDFEDYLQQYPKGRFAVTARVKSRQMKQKSTPAVAPDSATLVLASDPPGAQVVMNGQVSGTTPVEISGINPGLYGIELRMAGHQSWKQDVMLRAGHRVSFNETLPLVRLAALDVRSLGADAEIFLNGLSRGNGGQVIDGIEPGFYGVEVRRPSTRPWKDLVNLQMGDPYQLLVPIIVPYNVGVFPGRLTGSYVNYLNRDYGSRTSGEWALWGMDDALRRAPEFNVVYSSYDGFAIPKRDVSDIRKETWKGLVFTQINTAFLRKKAKEMELDAILLIEFGDPGNAGPIEVHMYDPEADRMYLTRSTWKAGNIASQVAKATTEVLGKFVDAHKAGK